MKKIIHYIRRKPEHVRMHILHISTLVFGVILVFLWIFSLGTNLTNSQTQVKITQDLKPFSALKHNIIEGYNSLSQPNTDSNTDLKTQENNL